MTTLFITTRGNYSWYLDYEITQSIEDNTTTVVYSDGDGFRAHKNSGAGVFSLSTPYTWIGSIDGVADSESQTFDMRPVSDRIFVSGSVVVEHNADGTKTNIPVRLRQTASIAGAEAFMPAFDVTVYIASFPTIPRATTPTLSQSSREIGETVTINLPRASPSFTHDITYSFGSLTGQTAGLASSSGVATSTTFTVPIGLARQMVGLSSAPLTVTVVTKSGSDVIGSKTVALTVTPANASVYLNPVVSAAVIRSLSDGTPADDGVCATLTVTASVSSVDTGTEQNELTYLIEVSDNGGGSWQTLDTDTPGGLTLTDEGFTFTDSDPGTGGTQEFDTTSSYLFRVTITDELNATAATVVVLSTAEAIIDIYDEPGEPIGIAIGGMYDVALGGRIQFDGNSIENRLALGRRNLLRNARFRVNQYGTSSGASVSSGVYFLDGWKSGSAGSISPTWTGDEDTGRVLTVPAGARVDQVVEQRDVIPGEYLLVWGGTASARLRNVGGSADTVAPSPILKTLDGSANVSVEFTNGTVEWVALVRADDWSGFFPDISYAEDLAWCQRFFERWSSSTAFRVLALGVGNNGGNTLFNMFTTVPMRAVPSVASTGTWRSSLIGSTDITISGFVVLDATANLVNLQATHATAAAGTLRSINASNAWSFSLSAEL